MTPSALELTTLDLELLSEVERNGTLVEACRRLGIGRDLGTYRIRRLSQALGRPVVTGHRGGREPGRTSLTSDGARLLREGVAGAPVRLGRPSGVGGRAVVWTGRFHAGPAPTVRVSEDVLVRVAFRAGEEELVSVRIAADAVLLARHRFETSARNVFPATVRRVRTGARGTGGSPRLVELSVGRVRLLAAVTTASVRDLALRPGRRVVAYLKATAVHRQPIGPRAASPERPRR